jgi:hypothetical protein
MGILRPTGEKIMKSISLRTRVSNASKIWLLTVLLGFSMPAIAQTSSSPLSGPEMNKVMSWIAVRTSALRLPYCYKDSYTRPITGTPGRVADCPPSYTNNGLTCGRGADSFSAPSRVADCPAGYTNTGVSCFLPVDTYTKGCTTIFKKYGCRPGYTDNGCFCGRGADTISLSRATCPAGYFKGALNQCNKICPEGYTNTGETCFKAVSTLGTSAMTCSPNERKDSTGARCLPATGGDCGPGKEVDAGLCYPACKSGFSGAGIACYQKCPSFLPFSCAAGCAKNQGQCIESTLDMVSSVVSLAINLVSLGQAAPATKAAKAATSASKMKKMFNTAKELVGTAKDIYTVAGAFRDQVDLFATEFADNFEVWTSPEISAEIDRRFSRQAALEIKRQWGYRHFNLMLEADGIKSAKNVMTAAGVVDPTGLVDVVNAFTNPKCSQDVALPNVQERTFQPRPGPQSAPRPVIQPGPQPKPAPPSAKAIKIGNLYSFESINFRGEYIRHASSVFRKSLIATDLDKKDGTFRIVSVGSVDGYQQVVLQSVNFPDRYLTVMGDGSVRLELWDGKSNNVKFTIEVVEGSGLKPDEFAVRFNRSGTRESLTHQNGFIRSRTGSGELFEKDRLFIVRSPLTDPNPLIRR